MKTSSSQRPSVQPPTLSVPCSSTQDSKQLLGVWHQHPSVADTESSSSQQGPTLRRPHTRPSVGIKAITKETATPSVWHQRPAWGLLQQLNKLKSKDTPRRQNQRLGVGSFI
ncbi:hypothetical protein PIB30_044969 [Stylosanthes scabra]|uniref:Uncharacterized protein n=1 Tax=Stylosanthes scabra TaxID=79078 RepID=A0ABU6UGI7_9FABA|nr:hypothetical protein [Stylosanthes scabra]